MESMTASTINEALHDPVDRATVEQNVQSAVNNHRHFRSMYQGGLTAERQSWNHLRKQTRSAIRAAYLPGIGRKIELIDLLSQRDKANAPIWTIVDPAREIGSTNGQVTREGYVRIQPIIRTIEPYRLGYQYLETHRSCNKHCIPSGIPSLPQKARSIITNFRIRRLATWIGVLFQPDTWYEANPDPAIVVEWKDLPNEYFCLAIWGSDRPNIEEFIY
jgi:hypothetical protein